MPWINKELCTGCETCVDECSVGAILMEGDIAFIKEDECIRCGVCHDVCPENAVRHDSERIPDEVEANIEKTKSLLKHFETPQEQQSFLERMIRYFRKEQKVAGLTIDKLAAMKADFGGVKRPLSPHGPDS